MQKDFNLLEILWDYDVIVTIYMPIVSSNRTVVSNKQVRVPNFFVLDFNRKIILLELVSILYVNGPMVMNNYKNIIS